jgi:protocatechuate 3,4-dioxygenase beta subunit
MRKNRIIPLVVSVLFVTVFVWNRQMQDVEVTEPLSVTDVLRDEDAEQSSAQRATVADSTDRIRVETAPPKAAAATPIAANLDECAFRVLNPDGTPAISIEVKLDGNSEVRNHLTDAAGVARIPRTEFATGWVMTMRDGDCAASGDLTAKSFPGGLRAEHEVSLYPLTKVRGRVLSLDAEPLPRAQVSARVAGTRLFGGTPRERKEINVDTDGRFETLLEVHGGEWTFTAKVPGYSRTTISDAITVDMTNEIILRCGKGSAITGVVIDPHGDPVSGAMVVLGRYDEFGNPIQSRIMRQAQTGTAGDFRIEVSEGAGWALMVQAKGWCSPDPVFIDIASDETHFVSLQLITPASISGSVVWENGDPVVKARIAAMRDVTHRPELDRVKKNDLMLKYGYAAAQTDAEGRFELLSIRPGQGAYTLRCLPDPKLRDRYVDTLGVMPDEHDVRIVLSEAELQGGVLEVRVHYADTGEPLSKSTWHLFERTADGGWESRGMRSFDDGVLRREGLSPGVEYCGMIDPRGVGYLGALIEPFTARVGTQSFDISMPRAERIELVVPADSGGVRADRVNVRPIDPHPGDDSARSEAVGDDATVVLHLRPGRYAARAGEGAELEFEVIVTERGVTAPITLPADH